MFSEGYHGPLGKILCPSNWRPHMAHSSHSPLTTPDPWVLGLPTHKLGLLSGGPLRRQGVPALALASPAGASRFSD